MAGRTERESDVNNAGASFLTTPPVISLPKGGGAIRGIGEKFGANPATGTGSMSVPIFASPGRSGFGPQLSLSYDSGAGNSIFGLGWSLALPSITRKTEKGLPRYDDAAESDVFILSGAEDLVPVLNEAGTERDVRPPRNIARNAYLIQRYRPRIEGLFARIERWTNQNDPTDVFWRSISRDNVTTWYGRTRESRIFDPDDRTRIFSWLVSQSHDDKGNVVVYRYKPEDSRGIELETINLVAAHERNRSTAMRAANRYLKRIFYGNHDPYLPRLGEFDDWPLPPDSAPLDSVSPGALTPLEEVDASKNWYFELTFDYGEHDLNAPTPMDSGPWSCRNDPFSTYRATFEVRTYRLCHRALMYHHFPGERDVDVNCLIRSTDFRYSYEENPHASTNPIFSFLLEVSQVGYKRDGQGGYLAKSLPPLTFEYSRPQIDETIHEVDRESLENLPYGIDGRRYEWVDLDGEGLSGVLTEQSGALFYKGNLSPINGGGAKFSAYEIVARQPALVSGGVARYQLLDLAGDGQLDLVDFQNGAPGIYERSEGEGWETLKPFDALPVVDWSNPNLKFIDLTGDGHADILIGENEAFCWHPSLAEAGFGPAQQVRNVLDEEAGPAIVFADSSESIFLADFSGDGLTDIVRVRNGEVCYWPNLGYGRFGAKVTMDDAPWFEAPDLFDGGRIRLADLDGSGVTDIVYIAGSGVQLYFNQSGNSWSGSTNLSQFPRVDNLDTVMALDLLGNGTACLVWSSPLPGDARHSMRYIDLMGGEYETAAGKKVRGQKPHLLINTINNLGSETSVEYASSTEFYLRDKLAGNPWITRLPFPVHCVKRVSVYDKWRGTTFTTTYSYHHGHFDGVEREFRGFGRVDQVDAEDYGKFLDGNTQSPYITDDRTLYQPPVKTVTWFHTGVFIDEQQVLSQYSHEYFPNWFESMSPDTTDVLGGFQENLLPEPDLADADLTGDEWREALRACKGMPLRQEIYELDVDALYGGEEKPVKLFSTVYHNCHIDRLQRRGINPHAVFLVTESEAITYHYELDLNALQVRPDPRIAHTLNLQIDEVGNVLQSVAVAYPRIEPETSFAAEVLADKPLAYYRFGEAAGTTNERDLSGNANHGAVSASGITFGEPGFQGVDTAALFDGQTGRIIVPNSDSLNPPHITMEARVRWDGPHPLSPGIYQRILEKSSFAELAQYGFGILPDGHVQVELRTSSTPISIDANSSAVVTPGAETHIAVAYDGEVIRIYLNGVLDSETSAPGSISPKPPTPFNLIESGLGIGNQTQRSRPFHGLIDEVALYDKALTRERIRARTIRQLADDQTIDLIRQVQSSRHLSYIETRYTNDVMDDADTHRLRVPCEVQTYELTGIGPGAGDNLHFAIDELRAYRLSNLYQTAGTPVSRLEYHQTPDGTAQKRIVEHARKLYFDDASDTAPPTDPLPFGHLGPRGLKYEDYKLALTRGLLDAVFQRPGPQGTEPLLTYELEPGVTAWSKLDDPESGYVLGTAIDAGLVDQYWMRSGIAGGFQPFFLPTTYTDPFNHVTKLQYDAARRFLFVQSSTDARGNKSEIDSFDFRVLAPRATVDANNNRTEAVFDILGRVAAVAVKGKGNEADDLGGFSDALANPDLAQVLVLIAPSAQTAAQMRQRFGPMILNTTTRFLYHFGEDLQNGRTVWAVRPAGACAIQREIHAAQPGGATSPLQIALEVSDGTGNVLMKKVQADPDPELARTDPNVPLRWIVNGLTVLNNKGKPVKQYEPMFSSNFGFEPPQASGVTPVMYYDAPGRLIRTEFPDGTLSRVEFSPWHVTTYDQNDTVAESTWYTSRNPPPPTNPLPRDVMTNELLASPDQRAAWLSARHAGTPSVTVLDTLGREVITVAHNRVEDAGGDLAFGGRFWRDEFYVTYTKLDSEGKPLWIRDALGHLVMQYITPPKANGDASNSMPLNAAPCYDIAGNLLFQHSMDAGDRWMLTDAAGKPMLAWDYNQRQQADDSYLEERRLYFAEYDALHRPTAQWLRIDSDSRQMVESFEYRDTNQPDGAPNPRLVADRSANLIGQLVRHYDPSGRAETAERDFKGNVRKALRQLNNQPTASVVNWASNPENFLENETFEQLTDYDALNRVVRLENWHRLASPGAVYLPAYSERGLLLMETFTLRGAETTAIEEIRYNAKGQKEFLRLGNGTATEYEYALQTFRLTRIRTVRPIPAADRCSAAFNDPSIVQDLQYTYDPVGNITQIFDAAQSTVFGSNQRIDPNNLYEYDSLYRLTSASGRESATASEAPTNGEDPPMQRTCPAPDPSVLRNYTQTFRYDPVGNIQILTHDGGTLGSWTREYDYAFNDPTNQPASNRLWQTWTGGDRTQAVTYGHDTHGNMLNLLRTPPQFNMRWDHRDMIASVDLGGGGVAYYQYDGSKQRTRKRIEYRTSAGYWERIYLDGYELYRRYDGNGTTPIEEIESHHLLEGAQRVLLVDDDLTVGDRVLFRYQYSNHIGSAMLELDDQTEIISFEDYHPYGTSACRARRGGVEAPLRSYRYTGKERDEESGLYYHGARYYMPWLTRWTSSDPAGAKAGLNFYTYGASNPARFVDDSGGTALDTVGGYYVGFFDAVLGMKTDTYLKGADWEGAYARAQDTWNWRNSSPVKAVRKDILSNQLSTDIAGGTMGLMSGFVPGAPEGSDLPPTMQRSYKMMRFASSNATAIVGHFETMQSIASLPPPGPPMATAPATVGTAAPRTGALTSVAVPAPEMPVLAAMASKPEPEVSDGPEVGEEVGDVHPKTRRPVVGTTREEGNKLDVLVEASKPSQKGKLTTKLLENPGTHDASPRASNDPRSPYNPSKAVMPSDQVELFNRSIEFEGKRYAMDANGNIHQFQPSLDNVYHWAGAENSQTASGAGRALAVPPGVRRLLTQSQPQ